VLRDKRPDWQARLKELAAEGRKELAAYRATQG
jgi:hypothetical protein